MNPEISFIVMKALKKTFIEQLISCWKCNIFLILCLGSTYDDARTTTQSFWIIPNNLFTLLLAHQFGCPHQILRGKCLNGSLHQIFRGKC